MSKIKVKEIYLYKTEGLIAEEPKKVTVGDFRTADLFLLAWSNTAPKAGGGYHKVDFKITYLDGETYEGRYDLKHHSVEMPDLRKHVNDFILFSAGLKKPDWFTDEDYKLYINDEYKHFLENYKITEAL